MPIMPRTSNKCQKIADDILGKKKKPGTKKEPQESEKDARLTFEESSRVK